MDTTTERGVTYQELLDRDTHEVPDTLRIEQPIDFDSDDIPVAAYTSRAVHEWEKERLWARSWQMACREEHIPEVGDTHVYEIAGRSYLVVRTAAGEIKGYPNACLHRGRLLRDCSGPASELRCAFHGFCWNLDGSLKDVPCPWDFPGLDPISWSLPEVSVGTWGGFVFINPDAASAPLSTYIGDLTRHFERWPLEDRYVQAHVAKVIPCNWKACQEAFMESFHVVTTHPQLLPGLGDTNAQYDIFGNWSRVIAANATPSPYLRWAPTEQEILDSMMDRRLDEEPRFVVPAGQTARVAAADRQRDALRRVLGDSVDDLCDAEMVDSLQYTLFPNFHPWGSYSRLVYRFRPNGDDHASSIMDVMVLSPYAGERPAPAAVTELGVDDDWTEAPELGRLAKIFQQDSFNLPSVQRGLESTTKPGVTFSYYQETKIRHFYKLLDECQAVEP